MKGFFQKIGRGFASRSRPMPAAQAPAYGVLARFAHRAGFSLVELMVVLGIVVLAFAIASPVLGRMRAATVQAQMRAEVVAALQSDVVLLNTYRKPDADSGEPRLAGVTYGGTAVFFDDKNGLIRFANDNQFAQDISVANPGDPLRMIERQTFIQNGLPWGKKAYDFFKAGGAGADQERHRHLRDPPRRQRHAGRSVGRQNQTGAHALCRLLRQQTPYGLPIAPSVFADLDGDGLYEQIPACNPAVIVYLRDDITNIGANPDDLSTLPGATSQDKVQTLLFKCHGMLVELSVQNRSEMDTQ